MRTWVWWGGVMHAMHRGCTGDAQGMHRVCVVAPLFGRGGRGGGRRTSGGDDEAIGCVAIAAAESNRALAKVDLEVIISAEAVAFDFEGFGAERRAH